MPGPYRTAPKTLDRARRLRRDMTMAEKKVWAVVRHRQLEGLHFRRQVPIGPFIADFCCLAAKLIVEVDGGQHADSAHDDARTRWLEREGFVVLRL
jgi:very-short-patch-repair endonuclease